jgi:tetratricopeptide (TPR) repeat protein
VVQRYPEERELLERARLYLRVCERELAQRPAGPQTAEERIYTATVALNAGDYDSALAQLRKVLDGNPDNDHAHYILSVALTERREYSSALEHLKNAVALNAENRSLALQDPDLEALRFVEGFRRAVDTAPSGPRKRSRPRK